MFAEDKESQQFLKDQTVKDKLASAKVLADIRASDYDAVFYVGGHGPVLDLAEDSDNAKLASEARHS
jgi:putative intracellular protease/amidase